MSTRTRLFTVWLLTLGLMGAVALTAFLSLPIRAQSGGDGPPMRLVRATFDPLVESPVLPHDLALRTYPGGAGLYLLQFDGPIQASWKDDARRLGAQLFDYVPDYAFLAWMDAASVARAAAHPHVRWVGLYQPAYRLSPRLDGVTGRQTVTLLTLPTVDEAAFRARLETLGASVQGVNLNKFGGYFHLAVDTAQLPALAHLPPAVWIEPRAQPQLLNDVARGPGIMNVEKVWQDLGLYGAGQIVGVCDTGLDVGVNDETMSDDFEGRIVELYEVGLFPLDGPDDQCTGHGTHVAGSVLGSGVNSGSDPDNHDYAGSFAGLAPEAGLVFQAIEWAMDPTDPPTGCLTIGLQLILGLDDLFQAAYDYGARIHTNSWGDINTSGDYNDWSQQVDQFTWEHKDFTLLFSAGNEGTDADANGVVDPDSLLAPGTAKNCITVGASENDRLTPSPNPDSFYYGKKWPKDFVTEPISSDLAADAPFGMAAFSSRGPTDDGRIKPDVVAPGTWILSAYSQANHLEDGGHQYAGWGNPPNRWYKYIGGTSMSAPLTAGAATLVRDYYNDVAGLPAPSSALIKATLINGAYDLTPGQYGSGAFQEVSGRPDNVQGWGRVDLAHALIPDPPRTWWYDDHGAGLSTGDVITYTGSFTSPLVVTSADEPLRVSLVWTDYPATPPAGGLVNDLDLEVIGPGNTHYYGNGSAGDRTNNVEGVDILTPTLGTFTVTVRAYNVAQETQPYALVVSGALSDPSCKTLNGVTLTTTEAAIPPGTVSVGWHVPFTATVSPPTATAPIGYAWAFGDGQGHSGVVSTTAHAYEAAGLYTVVVTATNCGDAPASDSLQIEVACRALSGVELFTSSPVEMGQSATFSAAVTPSDASPLITYTWDFGDTQGDSGTISTTQHLYAQPGLYTVTVTATNCGGSAVFSDEALVEVVCVSLTGVSASANDPVLTGRPMSFQSSVAPPTATRPITYSWDFGGAGAGSDLDGPGPTFTYTQAGTYTVSLAVTNCDGNGLALDTFQVLVQDTCQPMTGVTASADDPVRLGEPVHFQATASPPDATQLISYTWDFGAAGEGSGLNGPSPVFTYTEVGTHTVTVTVTNCGGQVTGTLQVVVQEADTCLALVEVTASADDPVALGRALHFQASVSPPEADEPITYAWNFGAAGSGSGLDGPSPVFTYTEAGTHDVVVAATNCGGAGLDVDELAVVVTCEEVFLPILLRK